METPEKKILRIRKGEYLMAIASNGVVTTHNKDKAMDISPWSLEQLGHILGSLKRLGYSKATVEVLEKTVKEDILDKADASIRKLLNKEGYDSVAIDEATRKAKELLGHTVGRTGK
jgi:hypothetical protein